MNKSAKDTKKFLRLPSWTPNWLSALFRIGFRLSLISLILFLITACFYYYLATKYDLDKVAKVTEPHLILAEDRSKLATLSSETPKRITYGEIPLHLIDALLAREDTNFRKHIGIDLRGLARATLKNIKEMSYQEGASTISMQLTKNTYGNKSKSLHRKLLEIAITLRLEGKYKKKEILTHYLNRIYFGSGCHGIEEAANTYFGINSNQLTLGQSALLVGIIRGPHIFSPFNNLESAIAQRDQVLKRMLSLDKITANQYSEAILAPLNVAEKESKQSTRSYAVRSIIRHQQQIIDTSEISEGGLEIHSTIRKTLNSIITKDIQTITAPINQNNPTPLQAAVVILENHTGAVRALIGGSDSKKYPYNRVLDSKQKLGSAFTPFIYLAALDRGKIPLKGQPIVTAKQIGVKDLLGFASRFGINHKPADKADDLYRGNIYASPLQLANAYAIIQNQGIRADSYFIESISNKKGTALFTQQPYEKETVAKGAAINCLNMLTSKKSHLIQQTHYAYKHAWVITSNKDHTIAIWLGHDLPKTIPDKEMICKKLQALSLKWLQPLQK